MVCSAASKAASRGLFDKSDAGRMLDGLIRMRANEVHDTVKCNAQQFFLHPARLLLERREFASRVKDALVEFALVCCVPMIRRCSKNTIWLQETDAKFDAQADFHARC